MVVVAGRCVAYAMQRAPYCSQRVCRRLSFTHSSVVRGGQRIVGLSRSLAPWSKSYEMTRAAPLSSAAPWTHVRAATPKDDVEQGEAQAVDRLVADLDPQTYYAEVRKTETQEQKLGRLKWQSQRRGMVETELFMKAFAERYLASMSAEELDAYDHMLQQVR